MKIFKVVFNIVTLYYYSNCLVSAKCPFKNSNDAIPNDATHEKHLRRRRLASLSEDPVTKENLNKIVKRRGGEERILQECLSEEDYHAIDLDIAELSSAIVSEVDRSHFLGAIVRLAAHDFMDYDQSTSPNLGSDGCLDFNHSANAGLLDVWCDSCVLTKLYHSAYSFMSRADFWIAAANAVIRQTSINNDLDLVSTFQWGRLDNTLGTCPESSARLPEAHSCIEVENTFLNRMGLEWRDAVALSGGHTLGRGDIDNSGHHGMWVDTVEESLVFDKRYFEEIRRRAWRPRNEAENNQDWTWAGNNGGNPRFMLNTDICLQYDIDTLFPCCTRIDRLNNSGENACLNPDLLNVECLPYADDSPRQNAVNAITEFIGGNNPNNDNNAPFYEAFTIAWKKATMKGWEGQLQPLKQTCTPTNSPTSIPTSQPSSSSPISNPSASPTNSPTSMPTSQPSSSSPVSNPTASLTAFPTTLAPTEQCFDISEFTDNRGKKRTCDWVLSDGRNKCKAYAHFCPDTCSECQCLLRNRVCLDSVECCSGVCTAGHCSCKSKNEACSINGECCSDFCKVDGVCASLKEIS